MAYDEGLAEPIRGDLTDRTTVDEKRMFGGPRSMLDSQLPYRVNKGRVSQDRHAKALT